MHTIILSIREVHASRIFQGTKRFELRKRLPASGVDRVYLYQSGGQGIVGCFDVERTYSGPVDQLWKLVKGDGTSEERFFNYFEGRLIGFALAIKDVVKFKTPLLPAELRGKETRFTAPMSFMTVPVGSSLYKLLESRRRLETRSRQVELRPLEQQNEELYIELVTQEIRVNYDEITREFAKAAIRQHKLGFDPNGIFTRSKEVLEVRDVDGELVGFTTLTYKFGGCVKTGPTVLIQRFRGRGYGTAIRAKIRQRAVDKGMRKLYCTCADSARDVLSYLLKSGFRVEAHLAAHYKVDSGEFVLGDLLPEAVRVQPFNTIGDIDCVTIESGSLDSKTLPVTFQQLMKTGGFPITGDMASMIIRSAAGPMAKVYEEKPLKLVFLRDKAKVLRGVVMLVPKRGGSIKGVVAIDRASRESAVAILGECELVARALARRKIFYLHPILDHSILEVFYEQGYNSEGIVRAPYMPGVDCIVMSKLI